MIRKSHCLVQNQPQNDKLLLKEDLSVIECKYKDEILRLKTQLEIANSQNESIKSLYHASEIKLNSLQMQIDEKIKFSDNQAVTGTYI